MLCLPCLPSVAAVVTMIANITMFEKAIPEKTSKRLLRCFFSAAASSRSGSGSGLLPPSGSSRISSEPVHALPEEQVRGDRRSEDRYQQRDVAAPE